MKMVPFTLGFSSSRSGKSFESSIFRVRWRATVSLAFLMATFRAWSADCVLPPAGLVAWWSAEGSANDQLGTNNGALRGEVTFASGKVGQAFDFNGSGGSVLVPDAPALRFTDSMTVEAWIYPRAWGGSPREIVSKWFGGNNQLSYTTSIGTSGQAYFLVSSDGRTSTRDVDYTDVYTTSTIPLNQWSHFAATYDGAWLKIYLNGTLENQVPWANGIFPGTAPLVIGEAYVTSLFNGLIDEPSVYSRALSASEIVEIYNAGSAGKCTPPSIKAPPSIKVQPRNQVGYWGKNVIFTVTAEGSVPLGYQWQKAGVPISGATGSSLILTNLQTVDAGNYSVIVTNSVGSVTSSNAYLTVNPAGVSLALYSGITIDGVVGLTYGIQYNTDLGNTNGWRGMANVTLGTATALWFDVQPAYQPQRYYRVVPGPIPVP
jgi:hypothetical protein